MTGVPPLCVGCRFYRPRGDVPGSKPKCAAFPDGIPDDIMVNGFDHREHYPGDNGIRFLLADGFKQYLRNWERVKAAFEEAKA